MTINKTQMIKELEKITEEGKMDLVFEKIEKILKSKETTKMEKIQAKIWKSMVLFWVGNAESSREKNEEGRKIASETLSECEELGETELIFDALVWYNWYLWAFSKTKEFVEGIERQEEIYHKLEEKGCSILKEKKSHLLILKGNVGIAKAMYIEDYKWDNQESIKFLEEGVEKAMNTKNKMLQIIGYSQLGTMYSIVANFDKTIEVLNKTLEILKEMKNDYFIGVVYTLIGWEYFNKGDYDIFLEYIKKASEIYEEIGNERLIAQALGQIGVYHSVKGEFKEALDHTLKAYNILTENGKKKNVSSWLNNIAVNLFHLGEIDRAVESLEELYRIHKRQKRELASMYTLSNISSFYIHKGELEKALEISLNCIDFFERIGDKGHIPYDYYRTSVIYEKKGNMKLALEYLEKALKIHLELENKIDIAWSFYRFITLASKYNKIDLAKDYYSKLEEIIEDIDYKNVKRLVLIAEGIILKKSKETRDRDRAEVLFDQLLQEDLDFNLHIEVLVQLCELLLTELKETSNERYLAKLQKYIDKLVEKGTEGNLPEVIIESLWFKSQLSLLMLDMDKTRELLTQALDIAERKGYNKLALKITNSKEKLIRQKMELDELEEEEEPNISKRMEVIKVENGFKELKQKEIFEFNIEKLDSSKKLFSIKI